MIDDAMTESLHKSLEAGCQVSAKQISNWKQRFGPDLAGCLVASVALQSKAREKLGEGIWWVTDRSLQQATAWQVAKLKSSWFGTGPVLDLCCGIGGDTHWLAKQRPTIGVDRDPLMIEMSTANLRLRGITQPQVNFVQDDAAGQASAWTGSLHIDPDRRVANQRTSQPENYSPDWIDVVGWVNHCLGSVVKLAPAADVDLTIVNQPTHRSWISLRGSVREQTLIVGETIATSGAVSGSRRAIAIDSYGSARNFESTEFHQSATTTAQPGAWMIDLDPAIRAAGLTDAYAIQNQLQLIGTASGFLTSDALTQELTMALAEQIEWVGPPDMKRIKKEMRAHNVYPAIVKARSVDSEPGEIQRLLKNCGARPVTLWLGRVGKKVYATWTSRQV